MKRCPTCGNTYRPDVMECPNDGTRLEPPAALEPPPSGPPERKAPPTRAPSGYSDMDISSGLTEHSTARSWIVALLVCLLLFGGYVVARDLILARQAADSPVAAQDGARAKTKKKHKKRRKRPRNKDGKPESYSDYDWEQDYEVDDSVFGNVFAEADPQQDAPVVVREPEPYNPKPDEWQKDGSYRPTARWSEPGADSNVVEIDLGSRSSSSPLDEAQVRAVLDERRLARCYDRWVQKIPQMRGRVNMTFIVAPDGHVASVKLTRSDLRSRVVEKCIVDRARKFRFPRAEGGARTKFDTHFDFTNR